jgi:hypothetical protein
VASTRKWSAEVTRHSDALDLAEALAHGLDRRER